MDQSKYIVTAFGSTLTSENAKRQAAKMRRVQKREEVNNQREAKLIAEKKRTDWIKKTYFEIIHAARKGVPWTFERYLKHIDKVGSPYVCTVGNYRVSTGGVNKSACFKTLAGELISGAIAGEHGKSRDHCKKKNKFIETRTENTKCGSDVLSAERRLTKRTKKEQYEQHQRDKKVLLKNIQLGEDVMLYITNLKKAEETLVRSKVPIDNEYWEINESVHQDKLRNYLKLWLFPHGGGKLSKTKVEQMDALKKFNLTKNGVANRIEECKKQLEEWKTDLLRMNM